MSECGFHKVHPRRKNVAKSLELLTVSTSYGAKAESSTSAKGSPLASQNRPIFLDGRVCRRAIAHVLFYMSHPVTFCFIERSRNMVAGFARKHASEWF
jgi:hypothetical protein